MIEPNPFDGVDVLLPLRIRQSRDLLASNLSVEMSALIKALPTVSPCPAPAALKDADPEQFKTWALSVIRALPTRSTGEIDHGNS